MAQGQSEYTKEKQAVFQAIVSTHMAICKAIVARNRFAYYQRYAYIDMNAGSGFNHEVGVPGSPIIAASIGQRLELALEMTLFEIDPASRLELASRLGSRDDFNIYGDHTENWRYLAAWHRAGRQQVHGLVYFDPNADLIPLDVINGLVAPPLGKVDILLHINANGGYKRPRGAGHAAYQHRYLADDIAGLTKQHWLIRKPRTDWQWTFLLGSDWNGLLGKFGKQDFYPLASDAGQTILEALSLSKREREGKLARLPFALQPTAPTPNISGIRASSKSGRSCSAGPAASVNDAAVVRQLNLIT